MGGSASDESEVERVERAAASIAYVARVVARDEVARVMGAGPPRPLPPWLQPLRGAPLGEGDLCVVLTSFELAALSATIELELGSDIAHTLRVVHREGSPWIECDVAVNVLEPVATPWHDEAQRQRYVDALANAQTLRLALWRYTCAVYRVGSDGAVDDDPIYQPDPLPQEPPA